MKIIAIGKDLPGKTDEDFLPHLTAEARRVWELTQSGILREIYFHQNRNDAYLFLECDSVEAAQAALDSLPLVKEKLIEFEIVPLRPYSSLERLFAK